MTLLSALIQKVVVRISQVPGTAVQVYAEDRIGDMIQHKFDVIFDELWWPQYTGWTSSTLDGSTGVVTSDLSSLIKRFQDIRYIFFENENRPIPQLTSNINPYSTGSGRPRFFSRSSNTQKVFQIWPNDATGTVRISYRTKPDDFIATSNVPMDDQVLILGAAYDYLEDDGANPGAIAKFQQMFESRLRQLKELDANNPIQLDHRIDMVPQEWFEA